jgi:HAD superfamily hydrolase (TIGR01509 family)
MDKSKSAVGCTFDNDGTLIDQEQDHFAALFETAAQHGIALDLATALREIPNFIGGGYEATAGYVSFSLHGRHDDAFVRTFCTKAADTFDRITKSKSLRPRPGVEPFLETLLRQKIPIALATATPRVWALERLSRSGLLRFFTPERILTRESTKFAKPAPDIYLASAEALGIAPKFQLVFEDSVAGVRAAVAAGSPVIAVAALEVTTLLSDLGLAGALAVFTTWEDQALWQAVAQSLPDGELPHA